MLVADAEDASTGFGQAAGKFGHVGRITGRNMRFMDDFDNVMNTAYRRIHPINNRDHCNEYLPGDVRICAACQGRRTGRRKRGASGLSARRGARCSRCDAVLLER